MRTLQDRRSPAYHHFLTPEQYAARFGLVFSFPADTEYVEYDNLASLRTLPDYGKLQQKFSGRSLQEAASVLAQLGIPEMQVQEVVNASDAKESFGLINGLFSSRLLRKSAAAQRYASSLLDSQMFCAGRETCVVFVEDSLAAFGSPVRLKSMLLARQGAVSRFNSNIGAIRVLNDCGGAAQVRGILLGRQLDNGIGSFLPGWNSGKINLSAALSNITGVGYAVVFDSKAHVSATIECSSSATASLLAQAVELAKKMGVGVSVQDIQVSSSSNRVYLTGSTDQF